MKKAILVILLICISTLTLAKTIHIVSKYVKPEKDQAYYEGNVRVEVPDDKLRLESETMTVTKFQNEWRIVDAKQVKVFFEDGEAAAKALRYDLKLKAGTLSESIQAKVRDKESQDVIEVTSDKMSIDLENDVFTGESLGKVLIIKGKIEAKAKKFLYDRKNGLIKLEGEVELIDLEKNIKMWADSVQITTVDDKMVATNAKVELVVEE